MENNIKNNLLLDFYGSMLTDKQKEIMRLYYECDSSFSEIATELGLTRQAVYDSVKVSKTLLESFEEKLKCVERYLSNRENIISAKQELENLSKLNEQDFEKVKNIQKLLDKVLANQ